MDIIFLHDLKVDCVIGVWEWERKIRQTIIIDLDMGFDIRKAAASDDLTDTLSYKDVAKRITGFVEDSGFQLVEKLAEEVASILLKEFAISWCRVRINKRGAVRGAGDVGVVIERGEQRPGGQSAGGGS
jgi:dihydroneopterin aldolase